MFGIGETIAHSAKRAGLLSGGLLLCTVGTGFLTVSGWFALWPVMGTAMTALIIAGIYLGVGLILIGASAQSKPTAPIAQQPSAPQAAQTPPLMQAFLYGLQAGSQADKARS